MNVFWKKHYEVDFKINKMLFNTEIQFNGPSTNLEEKKCS